MPFFSHDAHIRTVQISLWLLFSQVLQWTHNSLLLASINTCNMVLLVAFLMQGVLGETEEERRKEKKIKMEREKKRKL